MKITPLLIKVPPGKNEEATFQQLMVNLHEVLFKRQFAWEVASINQHIYFYCRVPEDIRPTVEGQIYAKYPDAEIIETKDYLDLQLLETQGFAGAEIFLKRSDVYSIRRYPEFTGDSMAGIFSVLTKAAEHEQIWIQVLSQPLEDDWKLNLSRRFKLIGVTLKNIFRLRDYFKLKGRHKLKVEEKEAFKKKSEQRAFKVGIRCAYLAPVQVVANQKIKALVKAFSQFNTIDFNGFKASRSARKKTFLQTYRSLKFTRHNFIFSEEELASVWHLPDEHEVPHLVHVISRKAEPPEDLPKEGTCSPEECSYFGITNYHNQNIKFGIKREDRRRHMYVVGKSGTGKSKFLELLIISDILAGKGVGVLDPHGDLVDAVVRHIPENRIKDVVFFNPADIEYPVAFNPLEQVSEEFRVRVTIGFIEIFKKLFGANWTPRVDTSCATRPSLCLIRPTRPFFQF